MSERFFVRQICVCDYVCVFAGPAAVMADPCHSLHNAHTILNGCDMAYVFLFGGGRATCTQIHCCSNFVQ